MSLTLSPLWRRAYEVSLAAVVAVVAAVLCVHLGAPTVVTVVVAVFLGTKFYAFFFLSDLYLLLATQAFSRIFYRVRAHGRENIPATGGVILVCNHVSFVDWILVFAFAGRPVRFVIDHVYYRGWIVKGILSLVRVIPIADPREDRTRLSHAYDRIVAELAAGEVVCIFPEGKITYDGKLSPFKPGVIKITKKVPVPVVPMALTGLWGSVFSRKGGPALRKLPRRFRMPVELRVGEPIPPEGLTLAGLQERVAALRGPLEPT